MNIAIGISTLLLGGWVLNTPVQDLPPEQADQTPEVQIPFSPPAGEAERASADRARRNQSPERALPRDEVERRVREQNEPQARTILDEDARRKGLAKGQSTPQMKQQGNVQKQAPWFLPPPPTDPLRANVPGAPQLPLPPTVRESDLTAGPVPVDPFAGPTAPKIADLPPSRQSYTPRTAQSPSNYGESEEMRERIADATHPGFAQQPPAPKAFAEARPYSSGVSPYMNLFRNDTNGGTIDNYSTYVRPALDQRSTNQQFNVDVYGLQRNQRIQNAVLQQMGRNYSRAPQSVGTPQFYMNYGNYYPGSYGPNNYGQGPYGAGGYGP